MPRMLLVLALLLAAIVVRAEISREPSVGKMAQGNAVPFDVTFTHGPVSSDPLSRWERAAALRHAQIHQVATLRVIPRVGSYPRSFWTLFRRLQHSTAKPGSTDPVGGFRPTQNEE